MLLMHSQTLFFHESKILLKTSLGYRHNTFVKMFIFLRNYSLGDNRLSEDRTLIFRVYFLFMLKQ